MTILKPWLWLGLWAEAFRYCLRLHQPDWNSRTKVHIFKNNWWRLSRTPSPEMSKNLSRQLYNDKMTLKKNVVTALYVALWNHSNGWPFIVPYKWVKQNNYLLTYLYILHRLWGLLNCVFWVVLRNRKTITSKLVVYNHEYKLLREECWLRDELVWSWQFSVRLQKNAKYFKFSKLLKPELVFILPHSYRLLLVLRISLSQPRYISHQY